ncbi:MAG: glycosyltransferase family 39 protein, partial [Elusimicrobia bacterium]|nr:glycosyltransferase family 39 protein [Elusimicrobiota bacterium]
ADDDGVDNAGWERGHLPRMVNPPLHHYGMALFLKLGGGRLWAARLGSLFVAGLCAVFLFLLAQRFLVPPGPATVLSVLTPAFWLSSYSLLIDPTMLLFFLGALWFWMDGLDRNSSLLLAAAGLFMGLSILTKYTGGFVVLLALFWWSLEARKGTVPRMASPFPLLFLLIPLGMLGLWSLWNVATYGAPHLTASSKRVMQTLSAPRVLVFLTFFSGVTLAPLISWGGVLRGERPALFGMAGAAGLAFFLAGPYGGYPVFQALLFSLLAVSSLLFFTRLSRVLKNSPVASDKFLAAWLVMGTLQMVFVMGWVGARYYLTLLPPVMFLAYRALQQSCRHAPSRLNRLQTGLGAAFFLLSLGLAWADYAQAETNRRIVADVNALSLKGSPMPSRRCYYLGDTFTGNYLKEKGWLTAFPGTTFAPGDLILRRHVVMPPWWFRPEPGRLAVLSVNDYSSRFPLRVMDNDGSAGFYASVWGALPFTISRSPLERFTLFLVLPSADDDQIKNLERS